MSCGVRVIDLTSSLGGRALAKLGVAYAPGKPRVAVRLADSESAPVIDWGGPPGRDEPLCEPSAPGALVLLIGPGAVHQARELFQRALNEAVRCVRIFLMPSAIMEEITLKQMRMPHHESIQLYRLPDSSSETLWFVLIEELQKLSARFSSGDNTDSRKREVSMSSNLSQSMQSIISIEGAMAAALVDHQSGMCLAQAGSGVDLELAAAGNTQVVRAKLKTMESLGLRKGIEDILITLGDQYHLIRLIPNSPGLFLYLVLDKARGNLALARYKLTDIERSLKV
jgi:hypothetical protein